MKQDYKTLAGVIAELSAIACKYNVAIVSSVQPPPPPGRASRASLPVPDESDIIMIDYIGLIR